MPSADFTANPQGLSPIESIWQHAEMQIAAGESYETVAPLLGLLPASFKRAVLCRASRGLWTAPTFAPLRPANTRTDYYTPRNHRIPEIVTLFTQPLSAAQIADRLNVPVGYVYRVAHEKNHSFLSARIKLEDRIDWPSLEQRFVSGIPIYVLAQELVTTHSGLWQCIRKRAKLGLWSAPLKSTKGKRSNSQTSPETYINRIEIGPAPATPVWSQIKVHLSSLGHGWKTALATHLGLTQSGISRLLKQANDPQPDRVIQCHVFLIKIGAYTA